MDTLRSYYEFTRVHRWRVEREHCRREHAFPRKDGARAPSVVQYVVLYANPHEIRGDLVVKDLIIRSVPTCGVSCFFGNFVHTGG